MRAVQTNTTLAYNFCLIVHPELQNKRIQVKKKTYAEYK